MKLPSFDPCGPIKQPKWIKRKFPSLDSKHHAHPLTSVREFTYRGHAIRIVTTYEITIGDKTMQTHAMVDDEGQLWCHAIPYVSFPSAPDMVRHILDHYSDVIATTPTSDGTIDQESGHSHQNHH